ncbi:hypothetical protein [Streptomyces sp. HUAS TT20]|uniref:hypothetical protein n=1 Tax=Streptomyces sp. HUAS TT20 TaxID=3447509 RepID=UPI0021DAA11A|nr:hypothetical protein [Streptomyces sp. HUAS 15-9]UXY28194.1 hypothetical protein N8I87_17520 [Streptomyces sp. HUAS 15-9]
MSIARAETIRTARLEPLPLLKHRASAAVAGLVPGGDLREDGEARWVLDVSGGRGRSGS